MSDPPRPWHEELNPLDLVFCHFPTEGALEPAPKPRPALVLNVADDSDPQRVEVAYGTSKKTTQKYAGEFELTPRDGKVFQRAGLTEESKFDLRRRVWLPYNERWFTPKPASPLRKTPKLGALDAKFFRDGARSQADVETSLSQPWCFCASLAVIQEDTKWRATHS